MSIIPQIRRKLYTKTRISIDFFFLFSALVGQSYAESEKLDFIMQIIRINTIIVIYINKIYRAKHNNVSTKEKKETKEKELRDIFARTKTNTCARDHARERKKRIAACAKDMRPLGRGRRRARPRGENCWRNFC